MGRLIPDKSKSVENELRDNYQSLMEVTRLLLKQVDQLSQAFKGMSISYQSDATKQSLQKKISEALEICDILRSAADLGKSPDEMIGYYLLGAKQQADKLVKANEYLETDSTEELSFIEMEGNPEKQKGLELSAAARQYAGSQREEMSNQRRLVEGTLKNGRKELIPLVVTKRTELQALEETINNQMDALRHQFDLQEESLEEVLSPVETEVVIELSTDTQ
ncbi:hypothetical protein [uncultured Vagococcus sp.]|uniref:hypothetical protein n=1 Tax=uncultured Vagococcus sp. TaxID=189676 RepID=UPI0028D90A05|nr:hypothetical protein [uncultured Vagococcus sp.]